MSALRRRQDAARRLPPMSCGHRDPICCDRPVRWSAPSNYGLTGDGLRRHAADLMGAGWQRWEVRRTLAAPDDALVNS